MAKYDGLRSFLQAQAGAQVAMTFKEVEHAVGAKLPASAYDHAAWWANDHVSHVQARAWLDAGYVTEGVDVAAAKLVFKRAHRPRTVRAEFDEQKRTFKPEPIKPPSGRHPMIGAMKGMITIEPGYDLTQPAMPEWADMLDKKFGSEKFK